MLQFTYWDYLALMNPNTKLHQHHWNKVFCITGAFGFDILEAYWKAVNNILEY